MNKFFLVVQKQILPFGDDSHTTTSRGDKVLQICTNLNTFAIVNVNSELSAL